MYIKWHGTASIELGTEQTKILFDPFIPLKGADKAIDINIFKGFENIFITHGHFDHIYSIPEIALINPDVMIYCTKTPYNTLKDKGVSKKNMRLIECGDEIKLGDIKIKVIQGKHAELPKPSMNRIKYMLKSHVRENVRLIRRENKKCKENQETVFYQIEIGGKKISLMGSMNLKEEIEYPIGSDLLILPYNGWEDNFKPAVRVIESLKPKMILIDHYDDTFPPITMPIDISPIIKKYPKAKLLEIGKTEYI